MKKLTRKVTRAIRRFWMKATLPQQAVVFKCNYYILHYVPATCEVRGIPIKFIGLLGWDDAGGIRSCIRFESVRKADKLTIPARYAIDILEQ